MIHPADFLSSQGIDIGNKYSKFTMNITRGVIAIIAEKPNKTQDKFIFTVKLECPCSKKVCSCEPPAGCWEITEQGGIPCKLCPCAAS